PRRAERSDRLDVPMASAPSWRSMKRAASSIPHCTGLLFVTRLACADTDEIEEQRQTYISSRMTRFMSLERGIEILEGALAIGRQADPIALPDVEERMSVAKEEGSAATSKGDKPLLATVQHLLYAMAL
ncbi:MAG TPA: hypothetical protein VM715_09200, partial [Candidatus Acidoferrum sp.]|nr:hypothetical protein [Candidatus Acidoferrum sp.]